LKSSLSSFDISAAIKSPNSFATNKISFKYIDAEKTGVVFSLSTRLGSAVERNLFKRRARQFILKQLNNKTAVFIRPKKQLKTIKNPIKHFKLFQEFLIKKQK